MSDYLFKYFSRPAGYNLLSSRKKEAICNGAGPAKWGWLVPDSVCYMNITEAANIHDYEYYVNLDKREADLRFFSNMFVTLIGRVHDLSLWRYILSLLFCLLGIFLVSCVAFMGIFVPNIRRRIVRFMRYMWISRYYYFVRFYGDKAFENSKSESPS